MTYLEHTDQSHCNMCHIDVRFLSTRLAMNHSKYVTHILDTKARVQSHLDDTTPRLLDGSPIDQTL